MNKNVLIVLGGAVIVAVLVALLVQVMLGGRKQDVAAVETPKTEILVAAKDLGVGQTLKDGDLTWQSWPKDTLFAGAVQRKGEQKTEEALKGRLRRDVAKGEPVMASYLLGETKANFVAASLEPGMRAVTIEVSATTMVGGFISVGDHVDVILTYKNEMEIDDPNQKVKEMVELSLDRYATERIAQNVKVLAVDQTAERPEDGKIKVGKTVTLQLDPQGAERIILAQQIGDLTLVLRGVGDQAEVPRDWPIISDKRLVNIDDDIISEYKKIKNESGIQTNIVRIYSGGSVNEVPVQ